MTKSDVKEMGLIIGQRRKCILAAQRIKNDGLNRWRILNQETNSTHNLYIVYLIKMSYP